MAIAFRSISTTTYTARSNTTVTAPASIGNGDILLLTFILGSSTTVPTPILPAGFTQIDSTSVVQGGGGFGADFRVCWKRALSESGDYLIQHTTASSQASIIVYSGCIASGSPVNVYSKAFATNPTALGQTSTATSVTTTVANTQLVLSEHNWTGNGTLTPPAGMTEQFDGLLYIADQANAATGATGARSHSTGNGPTDPWSAFLVALAPQVGGGDITPPNTPTGLAGVALSDVAMMGGRAVVTVASGGLAVVDVTATTPQLGRPVTEAVSGKGVAVTKVAKYGIPVTYV
jgi:hypothetical protein